MTDEALLEFLVGIHLEPLHLPQNCVSNPQVEIAPLLLNISSSKRINNSTVIGNDEDCNAGKADSIFKWVLRGVCRESVS